MNAPAISSTAAPAAAAVPRRDKRPEDTTVVVGMSGGVDSSVAAAMLVVAISPFLLPGNGGVAFADVQFFNLVRIMKGSTFHGGPSQQNGFQIRYGGDGSRTSYLIGDFM